MKHLSVLAHADSAEINGKSVQQRAAGRFYPHELIGRTLAAELADRAPKGERVVSILDPFCGDGRLVLWLGEELAARGFRKVKATVWDQEGAAVAAAVESLRAASARLDIEIEIEGWTGDTFDRAAREAGRWTLVATNPPWSELAGRRRRVEAEVEADERPLLTL